MYHICIAVIPKNILNKPADAGVLSRVNSPVNCKEAVHTARITEGVEEHG